MLDPPMAVAQQAERLIESMINALTDLYRHPHHPPKIAPDLVMTPTSVNRSYSSTSRQAAESRREASSGVQEVEVSDW
jgi:hypothetical protein